MKNKNKNVAYIVLEQNLIKSFFKFFLFKSDEDEIILNLLKHFKPFVIAEKQLHEQLIELFGEENRLMQILMTNGYGLWKKFKYNGELYTEDFYMDMLEKSRYKILLTKHSSSLNHLECHKICITDKTTHFFANELKSGNSREEAKIHIFSLIKHAKQITIIDRFLYKENVITDIITWFNQNQLNKSIKITLKGNGELSCDEVKNRFNQNGYEETYPCPIDNNIHDRYIIIDDIISINLTSGLENLFNKKKDFTYIISDIESQQ